MTGASSFAATLSARASATLCVPSSAAGIPVAAPGVGACTSSLAGTSVAGVGTASVDGVGLAGVLRRGGAARRGAAGMGIAGGGETAVSAVDDKIRLDV